MKARKFTRVVIHKKVDLDTVACAFLLGLRGRDFKNGIHLVVRTAAELKELDDPKCLCIEVGGSGRVLASDFDHHGPLAPDVTATWQAFLFYGQENRFTHSLARYVSLLDRGWWDKIPEIAWPSLGDVFSGLLMIKAGPVEQFIAGLLLLESIEGFDPRFDFFSSLKPLVEAEDEGGNAVYPRIRSYAQTKADYERLTIEAARRARWAETRKGRSLAYLETGQRGVMSKLYEEGADIVVVLNPDWRGVKKFTIGGKVKVAPLLERLNALEKGWGGPSSGTIIGSPWEGTNLSLKRVVEMVRKDL